MKIEKNGSFPAPQKNGVINKKWLNWRNKKKKTKMWVYWDPGMTYLLISSSEHQPTKDSNCLRFKLYLVFRMEDDISITQRDLFNVFSNGSLILTWLQLWKKYLKNAHGINQHKRSTTWNLLWRISVYTNHYRQLLPIYQSLSHSKGSD